MMCEVVEHGDAADRAAHFEPALDASEARERLECNAGRDADVKRGGDAASAFMRLCAPGNASSQRSDRVRRACT